MSEAVAAEVEDGSKGFTQKILDGIEKAGNKVPHPAMLFLYLIILVIGLSFILDLFNVNVTGNVLVPAPQGVSIDYAAGSSGTIETFPEYWGEDYVLEEQDVAVRSLISIDGIRFIFTSFVNNFANFNVVSVIFVAMIGVGVAEHAELMDALIRKLVAVAPPGALTFIIVLIGGLSSVATDPGYLISSHWARQPS